MFRIRLVRLPLSFRPPSFPAPSLDLPPPSPSPARAANSTLSSIPFARSGANSWLIQLEGGGWCNTIRNYVYRKTTRRGSSKFMEKQLPFTGILSNKPEENPDFFNWNRVKLRYCDGASFTGDSQNEVGP
ncbi:hypothetical protein ACLB2K_055604 [Fragaria x ananassa]